MNGQVDPILEEPAKYIISKNILVWVIPNQYSI